MAKFWGALRKRLPSIGLSLAITLACTLTLLHHYTSPGDSANFITTMETKLLDFRFVMRGPKPPSGKVGILAMDEKSVQRFGRFPFPRTVYEKAFQNLKKIGVSWLGFDVTFSEPERPLLEDALPYIDEIAAQENISKEQLSEQLENINQVMQASPGDRSLARALSDFGNVVMAYFFFATKSAAADLGDEPFKGLDALLASEITAVSTPPGKELADYHDLNAYGIVSNTAQIAAAGNTFAFFNNEADEDAIVRWASLVRILDGHLMPSLSLRTAASALNREIVTVFDNLGVEDIMLVNPDNDRDIIQIPVDPMGYGRMLINHLGPGNTLTHFSLADAYDNTFTAEQKKKLKGMSLLLGPTAVAINDQRPNPFDPVINGVENHAAVIDNIVKKDFIKRPKSIYFMELAIVIAIGLLFSPIMIFAKASQSGILGLLFAFGYYYFDKFYWFKQGVWVYMGMPYIEIGALFIGITLYKYVTEERERKKVKGAFSLYLSPDVINQVLDDPSALKLGGEKKELTVFFSDVRSFTTISESLTPEKLCEFMNDYFTPMTHTILKSGGVLDKYIGDAIMAFWGAPIPIEDAADRAAVASIQMLFALDKVKADFKQRGFPSIDIGMGLNTGPMSVGNMGSVERFCYTVMGDAVNLGARLEGLTKEYGVKILISEFTRRSLKSSSLLVRDLDDIRVKGKLEPVKVFELIRPDYIPRTELIVELIGHFEEGRKHYLSQAWDEANRCFNQCLRIKPEDGPTSLYQKRIEDYKVNPPNKDWDGVYTFHHK